MMYYTNTIINFNPQDFPAQNHRLKLKNRLLIQVINFLINPLPGSLAETIKNQWF